MSQVNKSGLNRDIPDPIKLQIRKNSKFGCVLCRLFIYEYAHINPKYSEAKEHDPKKICLLCPTHHAQFDKGLIGINHIEKKYLSNDMYSNNNRGTEFTVLERPLTFHLGNITFSNPDRILIIDNKPIISIGRDFEDKLLLNAIFYDNNSNIILEIKNNEWMAKTDQWDIETKANKLIIKNEPNHTVLEATVVSNNELSFDKLEMFLPNGILFEAEKNKHMNITYPNGKGVKGVKKMSLKGPVIINETGFVFNGGVTLTGGIFKA